MKVRIIQIDEKYYAQYRKWLRWKFFQVRAENGWTTYYTYWYHTAVEYLDQQRQLELEKWRAKQKTGRQIVRYVDHI